MTFMPSPTFLRTLPVSAASGLVRRGDTFYIVADDELALLALPDAGPARLIPLLPGVLSETHAERKAQKPDFEALCRWPGDGLLALGSGSKAVRHRGCLLRPGAKDMSDGTVNVIDMRPLYGSLAAAVPALNIEGAAVLGDTLVLLQRGNGKGNRNARVELDLAGAQRRIAAGEPWDATLVRAIHEIDLGTRGGAPLGFTDASPLPDGSLVFVAAAEASPDTYLDGAVTGAAIGLFAADGQMQWLVDFPEPAKLEGVHAELDGDTLRLWLVTDPDDRTRPADLYTAQLDPRTGAWR